MLVVFNSQNNNHINGWMNRSPKNKLFHGGVECFSASNLVYGTKTSVSLSRRQQGEQSMCTCSQNVLSGMIISDAALIMWTLCLCGRSPPDCTLMTSDCLPVSEHLFRTFTDFTSKWDFPPVLDTKHFAFNTCHFCCYLKQALTQQQKKLVKAPCVSFNKLLVSDL